MKILFACRPLCAAALSVAFTALTGCGSGSQSVPQAAGSLPRASSSLGTAVFVIKIPSKTSATARRPAYISPATQSISISLSGPTPTTQTANLTPTSTGCSSSLASTQCTLSESLAPGSYTGTIATYDGTNATGNVLSSNQNVAFNVAAGQSNDIALTLNAIPHELLVVSNAAGAQSSSPGNFLISGLIPAKLLINVLDADGNIIVGAGAPTLSISQATGTSYTVVGPSAATPDAFTLMPKAGNGASATFTVTASFSDATCLQSGAVCATTFATKTHQQTLAVENDQDIVVYQWPYNAAPVTLSGYSGTPGLQHCLAFDSRGDLFVADNAGKALSEYAPPYTGAPTVIDSSISDPIAVAIDSNGDVFVTSFTANAVYEYAPPYTGARTSITNGVSGPADLGFDDSGNLYVSNFQGNKVTQYAPPYTGAPITVGTLSNPLQIAVTPSGTVFALPSSGTSVDMFVPPYTTPTQITAGLSNATAVGVNPSGSMMFAGDNSHNYIAAYPSPYTSISSTMSAAWPNAFAFDAANELFSADSSSVDIFTPTYSGSPSFFVTNGISLPEGVALSQ